MNKYVTEVDELFAISAEIPTDERGPIVAVAQVYATLAVAVELRHIADELEALRYGNPNEIRS